MPTDYPLDVDGIVGRVVVRVRSIFGSAKLLVDDEPAPAGAKRGSFLLPRASGRRATARLVPGFHRVVPAVEIDGVVHEVAPRLAVGWLVLALLPLALLAVGGGIGGACGALGTYMNHAVARSSLSPSLKVLAMLGVGASAVGAWIVLATVLTLLLR